MTTKVASFHFDPLICESLNGMLLDTPPRDMPRSTPMMNKPKEASQDVHGAKAPRKEAWKRRCKKTFLAPGPATAGTTAKPFRRPPEPTGPRRKPVQNVVPVSAETFRRPPIRSGLEPGAAGLTAGICLSAWDLGLMPLEMPFRPFLYK